MIQLFNATMTTLRPQQPGCLPCLDRFGRVVEQTWTVNGVAVDSYKYGYDNDSNVLYKRNMVKDTMSELYRGGGASAALASYDGLNRLTGFNRGTLSSDGTKIDSPAATQTWTLDALGNWTEVSTNGATQERTFDAANQIAEIGPEGQKSATHIGYDPAGNMSKTPVAGSETSQHRWCVYDGWNRLVAVWLDDGDNAFDPEGETHDTLEAEYAYDGNGYRIVKIVPNEAGTAWVRTDYYYDSDWQVVEERTGSSATLSAAEATVASAVACQYVWDLRYVDTPVLRDRDTGGDPDLDERLYYLTDANHNVTAILNAGADQVAERYVYSPYGQVTVLAPDTWEQASGNASAFANEILYAGYRLDAETGFYQVRHRIYSPALGTWLQRDPQGYGDGMSLYEYCGGEPIDATDPEGQWALIDDLIFGGGGALLGLAGQGISDLLSGRFSGWEAYVGAALGGAAAGEVLLYTANPVLAGMAGGAVTNAATQGCKVWISHTQTRFDVGSLLIDTGLGGLGGQIAGSVGRRVAGALGSRLGIVATSWITGHVAGAATGVVVGGIGGGIQNGWAGAWEGAWKGGLTGFVVGGAAGLAGGFRTARGAYHLEDLNNGRTSSLKVGNRVHYDQMNGGIGKGLPRALAKQYPETRFNFARRGQSGPDVTYRDGPHPSTYQGSDWLPGNNYADFKPGNAGGMRAYVNDIQSGKLPTNTQFLPYNPVNGAPLWIPPSPLYLLSGYSGVFSIPRENHQ